MAAAHPMIYNPDLKVEGVCLRFNLDRQLMDGRLRAHLLLLPSSWHEQRTERHGQRLERC
jgi:hypothetical protein